MTATPAQINAHPGSCHCGAVRFTVQLDATAGTQCNCSICQKLGTTNTIVKPEALTILAGEDQLGSYVWGHKVGARLFCKTCGISCFGRGHLAELGGDYVSVPLNVLDDVDLGEVSISHWDGRHNNWQVGPRKTPWPVFEAGEERPTSSPTHR
jgi:hypothetical protein